MLMRSAMAEAKKTSRHGSAKGRPSRRHPGSRRAGTQSKSRWSRRVTEKSDALTLEQRVFTRRSPKAIAESLKRSAEHSRRRKSASFRSAMSMLTFYINRAGRNLPAAKKKKLNQAK